MTVMLRLFLQSKVVLSWPTIGLLEADYLLSTSSVETFVEHLALVGQVMSMLCISICWKSCRLTLIISIRHTLVATGMIV